MSNVRQGAAHSMLITAELITELVGDPPQLDALLEANMLKFMPSVMASLNGAGHKIRMGITRSDVLEDDGGIIPTGLLHKRIGGWNVARCSAPILGPVLNERVVHINRKFDVANYGLLVPKEQTSVSTSGGPLKSYHLPLRARLIQRIAWFAVGYPKKLRRLLNQTRSIGARTHIGFGQVARWTIEDHEHDYSWFVPSDGGSVLMRPLPVCDEIEIDRLRGYRRSFGACIGPYWHPQRQTEIVLPC